MTNGDHPTVTPVEIARQRAALEQAEDSSEMEGLHITATRADGEDYAARCIDIDVFVARAGRDFERPNYVPGWVVKPHKPFEPRSP